MPGRRARWRVLPQGRQEWRRLRGASAVGPAPQASPATATATAALCEEQKQLCPVSVLGSTAHRPLAAASRAHPAFHRDRFLSKTNVSLTHTWALVASVGSSLRVRPHRWALWGGRSAVMQRLRDRPPPAPAMTLRPLGVCELRLPSSGTAISGIPLWPSHCAGCPGVPARPMLDTQALLSGAPAVPRGRTQQPRHLLALGPSPVTATWTHPHFWGTTQRDRGQAWGGDLEDSGPAGSPAPPPRAPIPRPRS